MKKYLFIIALLLTSATFVGCGGDDPSTPNPVNPGGNNSGGDNPGGGNSGGSDTPGGGGSEEQKETKPTWTFDSVTKFEHTMSVWIMLSESTKNDMLAAFCDDECRGIGELISDNGINQLWCILVYGTGDETSKFTIKYWNDSASKTFTSTEEFTFTADGQYGTADKPKSFVR